MIPGAGGNHAGVTLVRTQTQQYIEGSTFFERASHLQVIEFQKNLGISLATHCFRVRTRRTIDRVFDPGVGGVYVSECQHGRYEMPSNAFKIGQSVVEPVPSHLAVIARSAFFIRWRV